MKITFLFFNVCLYLQGKQNKKYFHKDKNSIVYTHQHRLGSEGEKIEASVEYK